MLLGPEASVLSTPGEGVDLLHPNPAGSVKYIRVAWSTKVLRGYPEKTSGG